MNHLYHFILGGVMLGSSRTKIWKKMLTETPRIMTTSAMICDRDKGHLYIIGHIVVGASMPGVFTFTFTVNKYYTFWLLCICSSHHCNTSITLGYHTQRHALHTQYCSFHMPKTTLLCTQVTNTCNA